jgi:apolipoprotein N-acyltransferase
VSSKNNNRRRFARALIAGLLVASSMPPWGWWPLAFMGLAMFTSLELTASSARQRFTTGFVFGLGWFFPALAWMWFLTAPGYIVGVAMYASLHGLASLVVVRKDNNRSFLFLSPAAHMLIEVLRMCVPFGGVPLATLGIAQVGGPLHRGASVGGVILLSWLTWQVGALLAKRPRDFSVDHQHRRLLWSLCLLVLVGSYFAPRGSNTGRDFHVVAVQGGGPQGTRAINTDPRDVVDRHLAATSTIINDSADPIDLVVWPENVIDVVDFESSVEAQEIGLESARIGAPFAVGITEDLNREHFTNAQVIVTNEGEVVDRYDKVRRVPFGEYMPMRSFLKSLGAPVDQVPRDALAGTGRAILDVPTSIGSERIGVVISWEVFFGGRAREGVKDGAGFIINPTNGSSYTWTVLQSQQVASSKLRAIETGRWVVQVSPTGFSAFIDPEGHVHERTGVSEQKVISRTISVRTGNTMYVALGDKPWVALIALVFLVGILNRSKLRSQSRA